MTGLFMEVSSSQICDCTSRQVFFDKHPEFRYLVSVGKIVTMKR